MNKEPIEVDWSKCAPGTIGVSRKGAGRYEFVAVRDYCACFYEKGGGFVTRNTNGKSVLGNVESDILLPWESCIAEGHNPDGLTNAQVGEGWQLIGNYTDFPDSHVQYYSHVKKTWFNRDHESGPYLYGATYRVPITTPVAKVPASKATKRIPCGPEHFPPGTVLRSPKTGVSWQAIAKVRNDDIITFTAEGSMMDVNYSSLQLEGIERSIDGGKTWLPCYVEVEA